LTISRLRRAPSAGYFSFATFSARTPIEGQQVDHVWHATVDFTNAPHVAVIAIENTRLFEAELTEVLEYQTATSNVFGVISRSPNEVQPVFEAIIDTRELAPLIRVEDVWPAKFEVSSATSCENAWSGLWVRFRGAMLMK
jgi:hypothetical protein